MGVSIVYYTDNRLDSDPIGEAVRAQLDHVAWHHELISVSLEPIDFGNRNIVVPLKRGIVTMFRQILAGLEAASYDTVFFAEHDVLYPRRHFDFVPPTNEAFYYNEHSWRVRAEDGQGLFYWCRQTSALCADRQLLIGHYRRRIERCEQNARDLKRQGLPVKNGGYSRYLGFEPGCHTPPRGVDSYPAITHRDPEPSLDIRHDRNLTPNRWSQDLFRDKSTCQGWTWSDEIPYWGRTKDRFNEFLQDVMEGKYAD